jgi:tetratricopeptide (TPR) repeat protein
MYQFTLLIFLVGSVWPWAGFAQTGDISMKAFELRMNGDNPAALQMLDSALLIYPDSAMLWFEKGRCLDWDKMEGCSKFRHTWSVLSPRLRQGKRCFAKACHLDPANARYHYWAAENNALLSMVSIYSPWKWPAVPWIFRRTTYFAEQAVRLSPENPEYRYALVNYLRFGWFLGGSKKMAQAHADTLETIDPVWAALAHRELATKKNPYDVSARLTELAVKYPDHPRLLQQFCVRRDPSQFTKTFAHCARLLELEPNNILAINQLYRVLPDQQKSDALPYLETYLKNANSDYTVYQATGLRLLGSYYKSRGEEEKAKDYFGQADQIYPVKNTSNISDWDPPDIR